MQTSKAANSTMRPTSKKKDRLDWFGEKEFEHAFNLACEAVRNFDRTMQLGPFFMNSLITTLLIAVNELLQKMDALGYRVTMQEDLPVGFSGDLTDLVNDMRNAAAHISSHKNRLPNESCIIPRAVLFGDHPNMLVHRGTGRAIGSSYDDDVAVVIGVNRIYLKRQLIVAIGEANRFFQAYKWNSQ